MTTEPTETTTPPEVADAVADKRNCELRVESQRQKIEQLEAQFGRDYKVAVQPEQIDQITREQATLRVEEAKLAAAEEMLSRSRTRAYTRARVSIEDDASARVHALNSELGPAIEQALNAAIEPLLKFHAAGQELVQLYRSVRGRNTQGRSGVIVSSVVELNNIQHLQRMVNLHFHRTLGWWHYENAPPYGSPTFGQSVQGLCGAVRDEFQELLGLHDLDLAEVAAVRAEQRARGETPGASRMLALGSDADVEAFINAPDPL